MSEEKFLGEFKFVANRSFIKSRVITIPARLSGALKEYRIFEAAPAVTVFRGLSTLGSIRSGFGSGGRYYQVLLGPSKEIGETKLDMTFNVRVSKTEEGWRINVE